MTFRSVFSIISILTCTAWATSVQSASSSQMHIGLVIQDACEIRSTAQHNRPLSIQPRVKCALQHPYRVLRQHKAGAQRHHELGPGTLKRLDPEWVWLVEF